VAFTAGKHDAERLKRPPAQPVAQGFDHKGSLPPAGCGVEQRPDECSGSRRG
jgi:hypothetical protein